MKNKEKYVVKRERCNGLFYTNNLYVHKTLTRLMWGGGRRIKRETRRDRFLTYVRERAYSTGALITMTLTQFDKVTQIRCMQAAAAAAYS